MRGGNPELGSKRHPCRRGASSVVGIVLAACPPQPSRLGQQQPSHQRRQHQQSVGRQRRDRRSRLYLHIDARVIVTGIAFVGRTGRALQRDLASRARCEGHCAANRVTNSQEGIRCRRTTIAGHATRWYATAELAAGTSRSCRSTDTVVGTGQRAAHAAARRRWIRAATDRRSQVGYWSNCNSYIFIHTVVV